jgi:hypothetical protein
MQLGIEEIRSKEDAYLSKVKYFQCFPMLGSFFFAVLFVGVLVRLWSLPDGMTVLLKIIWRAIHVSSIFWLFLFGFGRLSTNFVQIRNDN